MDTLLLVTSIVAGVSLVGLLVVSWFAWQLKAFVEEKVITLNNKVESTATPARLAECETYVKAFASRIDTFGVENETFRGAVHKSLQRFDAIMRRNERALIGKAENVVDGTDAERYPDEIVAGEVTPPQTQTRRLTRKELRDLARESRR